MPASAQTKLSPVFQRAMALPQGNYLTLKTANINPRETVFVPLMALALTNATSQFPVIGTPGFVPCADVMFRNSRTTKTALTHQVKIAEFFPSLFEAVRDNDSEPIDLHVIGHSSGMDMDNFMLDDLTSFLTVLETTPNVTLRTFDVFDKPKPYVAGIDARDGTIIRVSEFYRSTEEGIQLIMKNRGQKNPLGDFNLVEIPFFDGTAPEFSK